ncbi:MAG: sulfite reductase subunit A [Calditrichaeota bacterium]|nr:MAG: sulfite reductase subunit A [Calditrichota bacterium]
METKSKKQRILPAGEFNVFLRVLQDAGYETIGPTVQDRTIVYDTIVSSSDLPAGWTDEQAAGSYEIRKTGKSLLFDFNVGPHAWKKYLHRADLLLWRAKTNGSGFSIQEEDDSPSKKAFIGVRACEVAAIQKQDKIFLKSQFTDSAYQKRRANTLIVAVNCTKAGGNCFCASMNTGPSVLSGFDFALTEILDDKRHFFVVEHGSKLAEELLNKMPKLEEASAKECALVREKMNEVSENMGKEVDTKDIKQLFYDHYDDHIWDEIATRCMNCANCTMVCPTCFCTTMEDVTNLTGTEAERWRRWDSCFTMDFSYIHGGSVRPSDSTRYRHWITHKFAAWHDQFEESGCVGCGRCITWCPVGIDVTKEIKNLRKSKATV